MMKFVNIYPVYPITSINPPIRSVVRRVSKSPAEIRACLMARARVEEILPGGKLITLTLSNYDKDNNPVSKVEEVVADSPAAEVSVVDDKQPEQQPNRNQNNYGGGKHKNKHNYNNKYTTVAQKPVEDSKENKLETTGESEVSLKADDNVTVSVMDAATDNGIEIETMDLEDLGL